MFVGINASFEIATSLFLAKIVFSIVNICILYLPLTHIVAILHHSVAYVRSVDSKLLKEILKKKTLKKFVTLVSLF